MSQIYSSGTGGIEDNNFFVAAASKHQVMTALTKKSHLAVEGDIAALVTIQDTVEMKNAPVMMTTIAARKSELATDRAAEQKASQEKSW